MSTDLQRFSSPEMIFDMAPKLDCNSCMFAEDGLIEVAHAMVDNNSLGTIK